jgi:hypothetical protein
MNIRSPATVYVPVVDTFAGFTAIPEFEQPLALREQNRQLHAAEPSLQAVTTVISEFDRNTIATP